MSIKFNCKYCNLQLEAKIAESGEKIGCPNCKKQNTVPARPKQSILCTQCNWPIDSATADLHNEYIKCLHCGYWEDVPKDTRAEDVGLICPHCESDNNTDAIYCRKCGKRLIEKTIKTVTYCEKCESEYEADDEFCQKDGSKLSIKEVDLETEGPKSTKETTNNSNLGEKGDIKEKIKCKQCGWSNRKGSSILGNPCFKCGAVLEDSTISKDASSRRETSSKGGKGEVTAESKGFFWGYVWIAIAYLSSLALLTVWVSVSFDTGEPLMLFLGLLALPAFLSGLGIHLRKRWGLVITNILLLITIISSFLEFGSGDDFTILRGVGQILMAILWLRYFNSRWKLFH